MSAVLKVCSESDLAIHTIIVHGGTLCAMRLRQLAYRFEMEKIVVHSGDPFGEATDITSFYTLPRLLRTGLVTSFEITGLAASTTPTSFRKDIMRLVCTRRAPDEFSNRDPIELVKLLAYAKKLTCLTLRMWGIR